MKNKKELIHLLNNKKIKTNGKSIKYVLFDALIQDNDIY